MLALERYNALVRPMSHQGPGLRAGNHSLKQYFSLHGIRLLKYIGPIILLATIFNVPKWLELETSSELVCSKNKTNDNCTYEYGIALTGLRSNNHYNLWYQNIANLLITGAIPLVSLAYLNVNIYLKFKQYIQRQPLARAEVSNLNDNHAQQKIRKREKDMVQQTMILFSVVILFGLFHILRVILNIEEFSSLDDRKDAKEMGCMWLQYWTIIASPVSHLLLQIQSSINFVIYCYFNKSCRDKLISWINPILDIVRSSCGSTTDEGIPTEQQTPILPDTKMDNLPTQEMKK
jgi:hypothetical protein